MDLSRMYRMVGQQAVERLQASHVAVFGLGGVGSFAAEAIARAGVGTITVVDKDTVDNSNINRQLIALHSSFGLPKAQVMEQRILDINPHARVIAREVFYNEQSDATFDFSQYDYVIDAIDTVSAKLLLAERCWQAGTPLISSMGTGNKLDPTAFEVADIFATSVCPLARVMRRELKKRGIPKLQVVYSKEEPIAAATTTEAEGSKAVPGSISFVPPVAGMILAGEAIKAIMRIQR